MSPTHPSSNNQIILDPISLYHCISPTLPPVSETHPSSSRLRPADAAGPPGDEEHTPVGQMSSRRESTVFVKCLQKYLCTSKEIFVKHLEKYL